MGKGDIGGPFRSPGQSQSHEFGGMGILSACHYTYPDLLGLADLREHWFQGLSVSYQLIIPLNCRRLQTVFLSNQLLEEPFKLQFPIEGDECIPIRYAQLKFFPIFIQRHIAFDLCKLP